MHMPLLIKCPHCKTLLAADRKTCETKSGKGCGKRIPADRKIYFVNYRTPDGKTKQKRIGPNKQAAEHYLRQVESQIAENRFIDKKEVVKITIQTHIDSDYLPYCKTRNRDEGLAGKERHLARIAAQWGKKYLHHLTTDDVEAWRNEFAEAGKYMMWNRIFQTLRAMYRRAVKKHLLDSVPFSIEDMLFSENADRVRWLYPHKEEALVAASAPHLRPIVLTALCTGLRKSDLLKLRLGVDVDLKERVIHRKMDKTQDTVDLWIIDELQEELTALAARNGLKAGDLLFTWQGEAICDVKTAFNTAVARSGILNASEERIKDLTFHDLRHCFAAKLVRAGVDLFTVQKLLGHKSTRMTQRYAHMQPDVVKSAMAKLSRKTKGKVLAFPADGHQTYIRQNDGVTAT